MGGANHRQYEVASKFGRDVPEQLPLPPGVGSAAAQWAQRGYMASSQVAAARAAVSAAAERASVAAAKAQEQALTANGDQAAAHQAAADQIAGVLGYNLNPPAVPTGSAYSESIVAGPPYGLNHYQPPESLMAMPPCAVAVSLVNASWCRRPRRDSSKSWSKLDA
eukprot:CAMPEP_0169373266 /NCGR_PEP_ID=MMETSP1017-20121227/36912_1 /TAXON_ID=342587 /ORGANISM="Karlodinium micrum, Strain CCMP2283" /LENGTH=164 /DNA_ID=CAMNT_0009471965 /DNA_START=53 /DNA_END=544 /DNA_ORIENTATION=+